MFDSEIENLARVTIEELDDTMFHERYREWYEEKELPSEKDNL